MNPLVKILCYVAVIILAACVISPPVYWMCQGLIHAGWLSGLQGFPFHRYFTRIAQITALILAWPLVRWLRIRSFGELNLYRNRLWRRDLPAGFGAGFLPLALLAGVYLGLDVYHFRHDIFWMNLLRIAITAIVVSVTEEFLFRGVLLGLALRATNPFRAVFWTSVIFALVHFLRPVTAHVGPQAVTWMSGFRMAGDLFGSFAAYPKPVFGGMLTLTAAGMILGFCTVKTRSLWLAIGMHAAWVFGQQTLNLVARFQIKPENALFPWVGPAQVSGAVPIGIWALLMLGVSGLLLRWYLHERTSASISS